MTNAINHPEYTRSLKGVIIDDYSWLLAACCFQKPFPHDSYFIDSVISVMANILLSKPTEVSIENCLEGISWCNFDHFSGLNWDELSLQLLKILKTKVQTPEHRYLVESFEAVGVFVGKHDASRDEEIGSLYLQAIDSSNDIARPALLTFLCNFPQFSAFNSLLGKVTVICQRRARSLDLDSKRFAERVAFCASKKKFEILGYDAVNRSLLNSRDYQFHLKQNISPGFQVSEVLHLICEFADERFRANQFVDVLDKNYRWCAAEIVEVAHCHQGEVYVHFTGWSENCDERIPAPSPRIAPAFTFTRLEPPTVITQIGKLRLSEKMVQRFMSVDCLNLSSAEQVEKLHSFFPNDVQALINCARWRNRDNLKEYISILNDHTPMLK
eukprot:TRINITY_DN9278_c0_g2_i1.p1 TRINITY_DN9278_c0_g2~~TRINITY_DN9278_c0_g2_i1.p1  ORF type:complete len:398 (+),score=77.55 TRINITY_DN9278_c0_g2_i1:44-1195(+)